MFITPQSSWITTNAPQRISSARPVFVDRHATT